MGALLQHQGKLAEAEGYFREALEGRRRVLGPDHPLTALSLRNLAGLFNKQRRFAEAQPLLREALEIYPKQLDAGHWWIAMARSSLGESLAGLGHHAEAEPLLLEGQRAIEASTGASAKNKRDAVERLIVLYAAWGRRDDEARWRAKLAELP
jgi:tetratricopeptide (TPR) repeat protein